MLFGLEETARLNFPLFNASRMVQVAFVERTEAAIMAIWVGGIFIKVAVFIWCSAVSLAQTLNLRDYRPLATPIGILLVALSLISVENILEFRQFAKEVFPFYGLLPEFALPLFLLLVANLRAWLDPSFPQKP
jgi:spore germination protein KB